MMKTMKMPGHEDVDSNYEPNDNDSDNDSDANTYATDEDNDDDAPDDNNVAPMDPDIHIAGVYGGEDINDGDNPNGDNINEPPIIDEMNEIGTEPDDETNDIGTEPDNENEIGMDHDYEDENGIGTEPEDNIVPANDAETDLDIMPDQEEKTEEQQRPGVPYYNLRPQRPRDYSHLHVTLEETAMTQFSMKRGIKEFGEPGVQAVLKELQQLHDRKVLEPRKPETMTREEKRAALHYLMFLTKKRCGRIKGRGCADGRKQRIYTSKEDASSPTVAIEALMLSCVIDAKEKRSVATVDIPGAFMQADMDDLVHMRLEGRMAELLVRCDPKLYRKYVRIEGGKTVLYVELRKALYGTLKAALLFWELLSSTLEKWGFQSNPYDACVMNKEINGSQCTVLWHVDDLKISHVDDEVVTEVIDLLERQFGKEAPLTKTRGKVHEYLGMTIDYSVPGKVKFSMIDYIKNMLDALPKGMEGEAATPASLHLFNVNEEADKLDDSTSEMFHHNTAKLLFLCKRARPDIQTAIAFLCTRVKAPDTDDYKKLRRVMCYLRATWTMPLTLEADSTDVIKWWADAAFAVHPDMRSHTGGAMTMGSGVIYGTSTRQKLTTKSSTEAELVGVSDILPQVIWTRYFLEAQGYSVRDSVIYQDNQSAIMLEKHGKASSSKRTRHINIRYFFVVDRIANKEVSVEFCPTLKMLGDYFTKPLQGSQFQTLRDRIMKYKPSQDLGNDYRSVLRNLVEDGGQTKDEWTMVQCRCRKKVGMNAQSTCLACNGPNKPDRECKAIANDDDCAKQTNELATILNESNHGREWNKDADDIREQISRPANG